MPEFQIDPNEKDNGEEISPLKKENSVQSSGRLARRLAAIMDETDLLVYGLVGICFILTALFALGYSFWDFWRSLTQIPPDNQQVVSGSIGQAGESLAAKDPSTYVATTIIKLISNLLLVLIIMEVLGTVVEYIKTHANSVSPFLFIGIISATRGILSIGARLSVERISLPNQEFTSAMIELGVNGAVIVGLGVTLRLLGKTKER